MDGSVFVMIATFFVAITIRLACLTCNGQGPTPSCFLTTPTLFYSHCSWIRCFPSTLCFSNFSSSGKKKKKKTYAQMLRAGGHTAEMLNLVRVLKRGRFRARYYIAAATDTMSLDKAKLLEESESECEPGGVQEIEDVHFTRIYRSREVGQSYLTSIGTALIATAHALWLILKIRPEVILCNGPGTCIPLCAVAFLLKVLGIRWSSIFYVESIARVRKFSLSGLILYKSRMADQIFVQWPQLQNKYPRVQYVGCLM